MDRSIQIGLCFLHLAVDGASPDIRRAVVKALELDVVQEPELVSHVVKEALEAWLPKDKGKIVTGSEETEAQDHKQGRLVSFLGSAAAMGEDVDLAVRENLMAEFVVLGHHAAICTSQALLFRMILTAFKMQVVVLGRRGSNFARKLGLTHMISLPKTLTSYLKSSFWHQIRIPKCAYRYTSITPVEC